MNQASSGRWLEIMKDLVSPVGKNITKPGSVR